MIVRDDGIMFRMMFSEKTSLTKVIIVQKKYVSSQSVIKIKS
jgi:hypothetical protein